MSELSSVSLGRAVDHTGMRFGLLVARQFAGTVLHGGARWLCTCDCGNERIVSANNLVRGKCKSCGCATETFRQKHRYKHGHTRVGFASSTYGSWCAMRNRCERPTHKQYADYGGRGITVCERWSDFSNFLADMGERPAGMTLDREDPQGNYEPGNCRWATPREQTLNQRIKVRNADVAPLIAAIEAVIADRDGDPRASIDSLAAALANFTTRRRKHAVAS